VPHSPRFPSLAAFGRRPRRSWHRLRLGRHPKPVTGSDSCVAANSIPILSPRRHAREAAGATWIPSGPRRAPSALDASAASLKSKDWYPNVVSIVARGAWGGVEHPEKVRGAGIGVPFSAKTGDGIPTSLLSIRGRRADCERWAPYQTNRQLSGWILPPLVIRAFGAHGQEQTSIGRWAQEL